MAKQPQRRGVSKPRLLAATEETMTENSISPSDPVQVLLDALKDGIVAYSMADYRPTFSEKAAGK